MTNLVRLFEELKAPESNDSTILFSAAAVDSSKHRIAMNSLRQPALLLSVEYSRKQIMLPSIDLENLTIRHDILCRITYLDAKIEEKPFTVVTCTSHDCAIQRQFLSLISPLVSMLGATPGELEINELIDSMVTLFRAMKLSPAKSTRALWAELFFIVESEDSMITASAWHQVPEERFDFGFKNERLELKSSSTRSREHYFSWEQVHPVEDVQLLVASVFVELSSSGPSIADLFSLLRSIVSGDLPTLTHIDRVFHMMMGTSWPALENERFDLELARSSLSFFHPQDIPRIEPPLPDGVTEVRFKSCLSDEKATMCAPQDSRLIRAAMSRVKRIGKRERSRKITRLTR